MTLKLLIEKYISEYIQIERTLDLELSETRTVKMDDVFCQWLGVRNCYLKIESELPTRTMKDRITEFMLMYYMKNDIDHIVLSSTGNTAASLNWGLAQIDKEIRADFLIPESNLRYHDFSKHRNVRTILLKDVSYDESSVFSKRLNDELGFPNIGYTGLREMAAGISYIQAFHQIDYQSVDYVVQTISAGYGIIGADHAIRFLSQYLGKDITSGYFIVQPRNANPVIQQIRGKYSDNGESKKDSMAWAVRRQKLPATFDRLEALVRKTNGFAQDVSEEEIGEAYEMLRTYGVSSGHTSAAALAGIRKQSSLTPLDDKNVLVLITGTDRKALPVGLDEVLSREYVLDYLSSESSRYFE